MQMFSSLMLALLIAGANAQCPPLYEFVGGKCLAVFTGVSEEFEEASQTCKYFGGKLVKIDDCVLLSEIAQYLKDNGLTEDYWIDATDVLEEGTFIWSDGTPVPVGAPFWESSGLLGTYEPQENDGEDCIAMAPLDGFYFHNELCSSDYSPLCQQTPAGDGSCTLPYISVGGGCFYFMEDTSVDWQHARQLCYSIGGDLAIIDDCSDMAPVINFVQTISRDSYVWLGGMRESSTWYWIDGSEVKMEEPFWGKDQTSGLGPDGGEYFDCVVIYGGFKYRFVDTTCAGSSSPICEAPLLATEDPQATV